MADTMGLLQSLPSVAQRGGRLPAIKGSVPSLTRIPPGCPFHPRCPHAVKGRCNVGAPPSLRTFSTGGQAACLRVEEIHPGVQEVAQEATKEVAKSVTKESTKDAPKAVTHGN